MENSDLRQKLPGHIATGLLITSTALWTLWGTIVMYHEGWGSALPPMWLYLIPALISLALALFALTWPRTVGWLLIALGGLFGLWWLIMAAGRARLIQGKGVTLIWAPEGPGWNWKQPDGWYASWSQIALFGLQPTGLETKTGVEDQYPTTQQMASTGLCGYLSADGMTLMDERQGIWRLPTVDEIVRSLVRRGKNAGCLWDGEPGSADCEAAPDKETPLWAPDASPIYYWAADEFDQVNAWYVSYDGSVHFQPKEWSNPRHSYRCVHAP